MNQADLKKLDTIIAKIERLQHTISSPSQATKDRLAQAKTILFRLYHGNEDW